LELDGVKCMEGTERDDENARKTLYYQWVIFVLVLTGILFKIPAWTWKGLENGLMETFYDKGNKDSKVLKKDPVSYRQAVDDQASAFKKLKEQGSWGCTMYYMKFLFCQLLAVLILAISFHCTDVFLGNKFKMYGAKVINYYQLDELNRTNQVNPMCNAFPTRVGCKFTKGGTGSGIDSTFDYCILAQNIINEKIYLFLWFWFVAMFIFAAFQILLEVCIILLPFVRQFLSFQQVASGAFLTSKTKEYLKTCTVGEWFVLYQIGKNSHKDFFFKFLKKLAGDSEEFDNEKEPLVNETKENIELDDVVTKS